MVERDPNRKSKRNFNLNKGAQHSFELNKKETRTFNLEKDSTAEEQLVKEEKKTSPQVVPFPPVDVPNIKSEQEKTQSQSQKTKKEQEKTQSQKTKKEQKKPQTQKSKAEQSKDNRHPSEISIVSEKESKSNKNWIWWIIGIIIVGLITLFCIKSCDTENEAIVSENETQTTIPHQDEQNNSNSQNSETIPEDTKTSEEDASLPTEDASISNEESEESSELPQTTESQNSDVTNSEQGTSIPVSGPISKQPKQSDAGTEFPSNNSLDSEALDVIKGIYGNAPERYERLRQKGLDPIAIQNRVNEMKRNGMF